MPKLPMLEESQVSTRPMPTQYFEPRVGPNAFGAGLGKAITGVGAEVGAIAKQERDLAVSFSSADAELKFGTEMDTLVEQYKNDLKTVQGSNTGDYQKAVNDLKVQYSKKLEEKRTEFGGTLKDPLALRNFTIRTKLQTQAATRHINVTGDQHVDDWRRMTADGQAARAVQASGNITGNVEADLNNLQTQVATGVKPMQDFMHSQGIPQEFIDKKTAEVETAAVNKAMEGYGSNYQAGIAFLGSKLPGTDVRIGFSPAHPNEPSILNGADTQEWLKRLTGYKKEKVGADLGEALFQARNEKGFDLEKRLAEMYKSGVSGDEIGKARQHFTSAVSEANTRHQIAVGYTYDAAYNIVTKKYDGNIDKAIAANDEQFNRLWSALDSKQANLRQALAKEDRLDPESYKPLGEVIDIAAVPGRLTTRYPTVESFRAAYQGPTKHLWPQALAMYERDLKRDPSQDVHYQVFKADVETRAKNALNFRSQIWKGWDEAESDQISAHTWIVAAAEQAWAAHEEARKTTPGAKESNVLWWVNEVQTIVNKAKTMYDKGAFAKSMPAIPGPSASATAVTRKAPQVGERRPSESFGYDPGDTMTWDGTQWVKEKK
jgi:hypothetical protein